MHSQLESCERKTRARNTKTKSGCKTCKERHVKCDETKPSCIRCLRFGVKCSGYQPPPRNSPIQTSGRALLPKPDPCLTTRRHMFQLNTLPRSLNPGFRFQSQSERSYFLFFQNEIANELSSSFDSKIWNHIVLQACVHPSIRQLTLSIAALKQSLRSSHDANPHLSYALQSYGRALKGIRKVVAAQRDIRLALLAALLIFCFENMNGNTSHAFINIQFAVSLLRSRYQSSLPTPHITSPLYPTLGTNASRIPLPSSIPHLLEDDILHEFISLDRPAVALVCPSIHCPTNRTGHSNFSLPDRTIPPIFTTIAEARDCYELLRYRIPRYGVAALHSKTSYVNSNEEELAFPYPQGHEGKYAEAEMTKRIFEGAALCGETPRIMQQLREWEVAFRPLFHHSRTPSGHPTFMAATILYIQALSLFVSLGGFEIPPSTGSSLSFGEVESSYDLTRRMLNMAWEVVKHPRFSRCFVFDIGIIPPLWIMVVVSPHRDFQREGIEILRRMGGRVECVWDSRVVADAGEEWVKLLERREMERDGMEGIDALKEAATAPSALRE